MIELLDSTKKMTMKDLLAKVNELVTEHNKLAAAFEAKPEARSRGPKSENAMNDDHARRVISGDLAASSHKECAELLGLSYGQIYSARKCFTFKHIHKEVADAAKAAAEANK